MIISAGGVVVQGGKVLLLKRKGNMWVLPKGHVEQGESYSSAALREVREETGVIANIHNKLGWIEYSYYLFNHKYHKRVIWYHMEGVSGELNPQREEGFIDVAFIPFTELWPLKMHGDERKMIRQVVELLRRS